MVWALKGQPAPLTHRLTLVEFPEGNFIVDVGLGGQTPTAPLRLEPGLEPNTPHDTHRVARDGEVFGLQLRLDARRETMYQFTLAAANWFTSTHPHSLFTQNLIVYRAVAETRVNLVNSNRSVRHPDGHVEPSALADARELGKLPEEVMNLALPKPAETIWAKVPKQPLPA